MYWPNEICIGKRRKVLPEDDPTSIVVVVSPTMPATVDNVTPFAQPLYTPTDYYTDSNKVDEDVQMQDWDNWDNAGINISLQQTPTTVYSSKATNEIEATPEPEVDFFQDMEPTVKVKKVIVRKKSNTNNAPSRLEMDQDLDFKCSNELEEWQDEGGWSGEEDEDFDIDETKVLREAQEQRKRERQVRAKQQRLQKSIKAHDKLGLKVS